MGTKDPGDYFLRLPKKELKELCQKYGLSSCKTRSDLLHSLHSYFKASGFPVTEYFESSMSKIRRSSRLSGQKRERESQIFKCSEKGSNMKNLAFPIEVVLANIPQVQCSTVNYRDPISEDLRKSVSNIRKSYCLSENKREAESQDILKCREKGSDKKNLEFPVEVELANMPQVQHKSVNVDSISEDFGSSISNVRRSSSKNIETGPQPIFKYSGKGSDRKNMASPAEVEPDNIPQFQCSNVIFCDPILEDLRRPMSNNRKSSRLSDKKREAILQEILECSEKDPDKKNLEFSTDVEMINMPKVQHKSVNHGDSVSEDFGNSIFNIRRSSRLSGKNIQTEPQNIFEYIEKGSDRKNMASSVEVELDSMLQVQCGNVNYGVAISEDLRSSISDIRRSSRLSDKKSETESQDIKGLHFPLEVELVNMPKVYHRSVKYGKTISEDFGSYMSNIRRSSRLSGKKREIEPQNIFEYSEKGTDGKNMAFPVEVEPDNMPQVQHRNVGYGVPISEDLGSSILNIRRSSRLLDKKRETDLQDILEYSEKGSDKKNLDFPLEVELAKLPQVHNRSVNYFEPISKNFGSSMSNSRSSSKKKETKLHDIIKCNEKSSNEKNLASQVEVELDKMPQVQERNVKYAYPTSEDFGSSMPNIRRSSRISGKKRETESQNIFECDEKGSGWKNLVFPVEVELANMPQVQHRNVDYGACLVENGIASSQKSSKIVPSFEYYVSSEKGINLFIDLNSSLGDWIKRLENETRSSSQDLQNKKIQSLRQEVECLSSKKKSSFISATDTVNKINISHEENDPSSKSVSRGPSHLQSDPSDGGQESLDCVAFQNDTPTSAEKSEMRNPINGTKDSDDLLKKRAENPTSDGSHKRKSQGKESDSYYGPHDGGRVLRSGQHKVPRRSMRLASKFQGA